MISYKTDFSSHKIKERKFQTVNNDIFETNKKKTNTDDNFNNDLIQNICANFQNLLETNRKEVFKNIRNSLRSNSHETFELLIQYNIGNALMQILTSNNVILKKEALNTIKVSLIKINLQVLQVLYPDLVPLLFSVIQSKTFTLEEIAIILSILNLLFEIMSKEYMNLFFPPLSVQFLYDIYNYSENLKLSLEKQEYEKMINNATTNIVPNVTYSNIGDRVLVPLLLSVLHFFLIFLKNLTKEDLEMIFEIISKSLLIEDDKLSSSIIDIIWNLSKQSFLENELVEFIYHNDILSFVKQEIIHGEFSYNAVEILIFLFDHGFEIGSFDQLYDIFLEQSEKRKAQIVTAAFKGLYTLMKYSHNDFIISRLICNHNNMFDFMTILTNLCKDCNYDTLRYSSYCLIFLLSNVDEIQMNQMNAVVYSSIKSSEFNINFVNALLKIVRLDDIDIVKSSLQILLKMINAAIPTGHANDLQNSYFLCYGYDTLIEIKSLNQDEEIHHLASAIINLLSPENDLS